MPFLRSSVRNLLLIATALIISLVAMEIYLRAFVPVRNVGPSFTTYDPIYGKRLKPAFQAERITPEFEMRFTTNALGYRGSPISESNRRPILFVGDSFTMGYGVSDGEEFPALVAERLVSQAEGGRYPVINAGLGNNGNGRPLKFLRREVAEIAPCLIVLQLAENDFGDNVREKLFKLDNGMGRLVELDAPPPGGLQKIQGLVETVPGLSYSYVVGFLRQAISDLARTADPSREASGTEKERKRDRLTLRLVETFLAMSEEKGWPVLMLTVGVSQPHRSALKRVADRYGTDLIPVPGKGERPDLYYAVDGHWNPAGHAHVADLLTAWMKRNMLFT